MRGRRYRIFELSAIALMQSASRDEEGIYRYELGADATRRCISPFAPQTQGDCALFHQIMRALGCDEPIGPEIVEELSDKLVYIDFSNIFDRKQNSRKHAERIEKAEAMFRPEGITLDFGNGPYRYVAFERSASMSRQSRLSFIRADLYEPVRERIMLRMDIGRCQLSKLYAYNGLMLTDGRRVYDPRIWDPDRIIVIDNPITTVHNARYITVEDDGSDSTERVYNRVEKTGDIDVMEFDGEGLISPEYAYRIDEAISFTHHHTSFQIRMPYIKGVVHEVNFPLFLKGLGIDEITDMWGKKHKAKDVWIILTKSMFKGFGWMTENGLSWEEYLARCRKYDHALYISETGLPETASYTLLNYQFFTTAAIRSEEFRPDDLPLGWDHSPNEDERDWITKTTEKQYYDLTADGSKKADFLIEAAKQRGSDSRASQWAKTLEKNPLFVNERVFSKQLEARAERLLKEYALGSLTVSGDNRFLSGDLLKLLVFLCGESFSDPTVERELLHGNQFYAPKAAYPKPVFPYTKTYTLLRNPHIARNEEVLASPVAEGEYRRMFLSHLSYVIMVDSASLIPERLGGADFDGDMVKTIADPLVNKCVLRGYENGEELPVLKIPSAEPLLSDSRDWYARYRVVRSTFDARVGQICNAAFDRSIVAYDENSDSDERRKLREETETLEILTGLEIDSAKSGVKPDLTDYLNKKVVSRSPFLKYKNIIRGGDGREWYEPTVHERLEKFFDSVNWDEVSSNVEKLPYHARMLEKETKRNKPKPAKDGELFRFARDKDWKDRLKKEDLDFMRRVISDYDTALYRIRVSRIKPKDMTRRNDIERILFMRGQDEEYSVDELYGVFQDVNAERIHGIREELAEKKWHLMDEDEREVFLLSILPYERYDMLDVFADFRCDGFRVLMDIIGDIDDMYLYEERKRNVVRNDTNSELINRIMTRYARFGNRDYHEEAATASYSFIKEHEFADSSPDTALRCIVALGRRDFALEVLPDMVEKCAIRKRKKC